MTELTVGAVLDDAQMNEIAFVYEGLLGEVARMLEEMGFGPLPKPEVPYPRLTVEEFVQLEGEQYAATMMAVNLWGTYANDMHARYEGILLLRKGQLSEEERAAKLQLKASYRNLPKKEQPNETTIKEEVQHMPNCRELRRQIAAMEGLIKVLAAKVTEMDKLGGVTSRQITLRGQEVEMTGRSHGRYGPQGAHMNHNFR